MGTAAEMSTGGGVNLSVFDFFRKRKQFTNEFYPCPGSRRTVMVSSYIWWTDLIAHSLLKLGYNVLVAEPWYNFWLVDHYWVNFNNLFTRWVETIRKFNVQLVLSGNATAMVPHPKTKELLHRAAGVPAVNYWWDEPRTMPPMAQRGYTAHDYLNCLRDPQTLNVFWDADVAEEMSRFLAVPNVAHVPLGTTPELWRPDGAYVPLRDRRTMLCFLGNNHDEGTWEQSADPTVLAWAERVAALKLANLDRPMADCVEQVGGPGEVRGSTTRRPYELAPTLAGEFERWGVLSAVLVRRCRNAVVRAAAEHLGNDFLLVGKGWDRLGLRAAKDHTGVPQAKEYYAGAQASLNLFGGCVHGGMPLRPYEIACSGGLLFTHYNRELPGLFEPGKECVAFRDAGEMTEQLDRIIREPDEYEKVVEAGRRRAEAEHTWEHRLARVMQLAAERWGLPW